MLRTLYRVVLLLCPREVRRELGRELEAIFLHCVAVEQRRRARIWWPAIWVRGLVDGALFAAAARFDTRRRLFVSQPGQAPRPSFWRRFVRLHDLRSAIRLMRTRPLLAGGHVLMLALGLGATAVIFTVVHGVLLRPLPFPEPDRLVQVSLSVPARGLNRVTLTEAVVWDVRDMNRSFEAYGAFHGASFTLADGSGPQRVGGGLVSVGFFQALGISPVVGRLFAPGEDEPGAAGDLAVLSHGLWTARFGSSREVVGRAISLDGRPHQVIGVLPPGTPWLDAAEVFVPFVRRADARRVSWEYLSVGRLAPGTTLDAAATDLDRVARDLEARYPASDRGQRFALAPSSEWVASEALRSALWLLLGASGLLLAIACVNVTSLQLAHASTRAREAAVRSALGARRWDLVRERLSESLTLSLAGAALAWPLAAGALRAFKAYDPGGIPRLAGVELDGSMLAFTLGLAACVGLITGLVPAWRVPVADLAPGLRRAQRGAIGDRSHDRARQVFVGVEVALSLVLLVGAGLLVKSLVQVLSVDRGFQTNQRLLATVSLPGSYPEERRTQIAEAILTRLEHTPGVVSVAAVSGAPLASGSTGLGVVAADRPDVPESSVPWATWRVVSKDYFEAMGLPLIAGRGFTEHDRLGEPPYRIVVSRRLASLLWPGENAVGKTAILWKGQGDPRGEVIGVVADMRERGLENDPTLAVYFPAYGQLGGTTLRLVVHAAGPAEGVVPSLRQVIAGIDPSLPVSDVRTLEEAVTQSVATRRFTMLLLVVFSSVALVLALAGVYGVLAYAVARRTAEIGVRLALGAAPGDVLRQTVTRGMRPVLIGLALGLAAAFWVSRLMASLLFQVEPGDPATFVTVGVALLAMAALACYMPARRVLRVDPVVALRAE